MPSREDIAIAGRWLSIIGIGEDGVGGLSSVARSLVLGAELVVGGARHLSLASELIVRDRMTWPSPLHDAFPHILARRGRPVCILATGDPFHFGIGKQIVEHVAVSDIICLPHASAFSLAAAQMGWALQDTAAVSLHGRAIEGLIRHLQPGARILALSWNGETPAVAASMLDRHGFGRSTVTVLEAMGGPRQRVRQHVASNFVMLDVDPLNTIAIEALAEPDARIVTLAPGLEDQLFEHDGQLTKREVRAVTLAALAPRQGELLWDIGLGAGSISIEWLLRHPSLRAIGIERHPERAARAVRNAACLGTPDLRVITGTAPEALRGLPEPDAVFIGGGLATPEVFDTTWAALKAGGRLVANAVTIESESRLQHLFAAHGGELTRIAISRAEAVGRFHAWRPAMPVTQWRVIKR